MGDTDQTLATEGLDDYSGGKVVATSILFTALTTIFLGLRFYSKRLVRSHSSWDDFFLLAAYLFNTCLCATIIAMTKVAGVGWREEWVEMNNPHQLVNWAKSVLVLELLHFTAAGLPKLAILFFYIRVFSWKGRMLKACHAAMGLLAATWLACVAATCFQCRPLAFWWDRTVPGGACFHAEGLFRARALTSPVLDALVLGLPVGSICSLKLPERVRVELLVVFGAAGFGLVASLVRVGILFGTSAFHDRTWATADLCGWSVIEVGTYIITACLAGMRPLLSFLMPPQLGTKRQSVMTVSSSEGSHPTSGTRPPVCGIEIPSVLVLDSSNARRFKDGGVWGVTNLDTRLAEPPPIKSEAQNSYREEIVERRDWDFGGGLTIFITQTTEVTVDRLESFDRPWEYLGPSVGRPTIRGGGPGDS